MYINAETTRKRLKAVKQMSKKEKQTVINKMAKMLQKTKAAKVASSQKDA